MDLNHLTIWPKCKTCSKKFAFVNTGFFKIGNCPECESEQEIHKTIIYNFDQEEKKAINEMRENHLISMERQRACEIILKYIVPPDNDGYWANDLLKDIINQIRGE